MAYKLRRVYSLVFVVLNAAASVQVAHAQSATTETANVAMAASSPAGLEPENASAPGGNVATLTALNAQGKLTELRSSSATDYQAQLLFYGEGLTYYVALLQQNNYWLVVDTPSAKRAEAIYAEFVQRTLRLSQGNQQRVELEARAASIERELAQTQAHQAQLQADFDIDRAQSERSVALQTDTARQVTTLQQEETSAQAALVSAQRKVQVMQVENASLLGAHTADSTRKRLRHIRAVQGKAKSSHLKKT
jgi:hypothetical protein